MPEELGEQRVSPTVRLRKVLRTLRRWRVQAAMDQLDVARMLTWSKARVSRIERGETTPGPAEVIALATVYGVDESERDECAALAGQARQRGWWKKYGPDAAPADFEEYIGLESEAVSVRNFEIDLVPGLLQTFAYMEALGRGWLPSADEETVRRRWQLRRARQARLWEDAPLRLDAVIGETAIRQCVGGADVMRQQLGHLLRAAESPHIDVRVLPYTAGSYPAMGSPFAVLSFPRDEEDDVVCLDTLSSSIYVEDETEVEQYVQSFHVLSSVALDPAGTMNVLKNRFDELASE
ncbi:helix-turn-helix domain-containing protein [Bounagaea algeriensis]